MSNFSYLEPVGRSNMSQPKTRDAETEIADFPTSILASPNVYKTIDEPKNIMPNSNNNQDNFTMIETRSQ